MARKFKTPITIDELGSASSQAIAANVDGDSQNRINIDAGGKITWGSGSATGDTTLYRSAADTLKTDDAFTATSLAVTGQFTFPTSDGSADQVITTNGSGTLTWSDVSANATVSDTAPSSPATGQIWYESDTGKTFVYYDSFWIEVGASPPASPFITDLDEDTKIQVEESSDEDKIRFDTAGSERMIIDSSGNVGIGTTTPGYPLEINGTLAISNESTSLISNNGDTGREVLELRGRTGTGDGAGINLFGDADATHPGKAIFYSGGSARLTIDDGNVGIGTTSPETPLNIVTTNKLGSTFTGTVDGEGLRVDQSDYSAGNYVSLVEASYDDGQTAPHVRIGAMFDGGGAHLAFGTSNNFGNGITNTALFIDETGNVGIGTTTPNQVLDVDGALSVRNKMVIGTSTFTQEPWSGSTIALGGFGSIGTQGSFRTSLAWNYERGTDSGWHALGINSYTSAAGIDLGNDGILFRADATYGASNQPTTRMIMTPAGNVGIGTTLPPEKLTVDDGIIHSRSGSSGPTTPPTDKGVALTAVGMNTSSKYTPGILFGSRDPQFTTTNPKYNAGIYGVATETYGNDSDTAMQIEFRASGTNGGTGHGIGLGTGYRMSPVAFYPLIDNSCDLGGSSSNLRWDDIFATSGTVNTSDQRDKANITNLDLGLTFVDSLRPVSYTWADRSGYVGSRTHMGFVAQEVATALGDEATNRGLWIHSPSVPVDPEDPEGEQTDERQGLRYHQLIAPMVKAIQELSATVQTLTDRIEALEAE